MTRLTFLFTLKKIIMFIPFDHIKGHRIRLEYPLPACRGGGEGGGLHGPGEGTWPFPSQLGGRGK